LAACQQKACADWGRAMQPLPSVDQKVVWSGPQGSPLKVLLKKKGIFLVSVAGTA